MTNCGAMTEANGPGELLTDRGGLGEILREIDVRGGEARINHPRPLICRIPIIKDKINSDRGGLGHHFLPITEQNRSD